MSARDKLNSAYTVGVVVVASVFGLIADSGPVFVISAAALLFASLRTNRIRP